MVKHFYFKQYSLAYVQFFVYTQLNSKAVNFKQFILATDPGQSGPCLNSKFSCSKDSLSYQASRAQSAFIFDLVSLSTRANG